MHDAYNIDITYNLRPTNPRARRKGPWIRHLCTPCTPRAQAQGGRRRSSWRRRRSSYTSRVSGVGKLGEVLQPPHLPVCVYTHTHTHTLTHSERETLIFLCVCVCMYMDIYVYTHSLSLTHTEVLLLPHLPAHVCVYVFRILIFEISNINTQKIKSKETCVYIYI